jgi:hypothetical protein
MTTHKILATHCQYPPSPSSNHQSCCALEPSLPSSLKTRFAVPINAAVDASVVYLVAGLSASHILVKNNPDALCRPRKVSHGFLSTGRARAVHDLWCCAPAVIQGVTRHVLGYPADKKADTVEQTHRRSLSSPIIASLSFDSSTKNYTAKKVSSHCTVAIYINRRGSNMPKKRRSLQSLFIPSFFHFSPSPPIELTTSPLPQSNPSTRRNSSAVQSQPPPSQPQLIRRHASSSAQIPTQSTQLTPSVTFPKSSHSPPPDYLLDDDPFADLTRKSHSRCPRRSAFSPPGLCNPRYSKPPPRSLLSSSIPEHSPPTPTSSISSSSTPESTKSLAPQLPTRVTRTMSSGPAHARPAHMKPAFSHRPSLPSLRALTQTSVLIPRVRLSKSSDYFIRVLIYPGSYDVRFEKAK